MLLDGPAALKAILDPQARDGPLKLSLHEAIVIARKSA
jgi:hypothetical protein